MSHFPSTNDFDTHGTTGDQEPQDARVATTPRLPETVRIGHARYTVTADPTRCADEEAEGLSSGNHLEIIIRGDRPYDSNADTLLHEIIHQCIYQSGLDCKRIGKDLVGWDAEEAIIRAVSGTLLGSLRDNPDLIAYLLHE